MSFFQSPDFIRFVTGLDRTRAGSTCPDSPQDGLVYLSQWGGGLRKPLTHRTLVMDFPSPRLDPSTLAVHLENLVQANRSSLFIQIRTNGQPHPFAPALLQAGFRVSQHLNLIKPIHDLGQAFHDLDESRRREIRHNQRHGLRIGECESEADLRSFYEILRHTYDMKARKPLPGYDFFLRFHQFSRTGQLHGKIWLAWVDSRVVGGIVCPYSPDSTLYEWYISGLDQEFRPHKIFPSVGLTWGAMEFGHHMGIRQFDFMGLGKPAKPYGVRDFKLRFGGKVVNGARYNFVNKPVMTKFSEWGFNLWKFLGPIL